MSNDSVYRCRDGRSELIIECEHQLQAAAEFCVTTKRRGRRSFVVELMDKARVLEYWEFTPDGDLKC